MVPTAAGARARVALLPSGCGRVARDLRKSGAIEQDADVVMMLYRPEYYPKYRDDEELRGLAEIIVAKHRNGPTRDLTVAFQGHYSRFVDMAH